MSIVIPYGHNMTRFLAIDPGSTKAGIAKFTINNNTDSIIDIEAGTLNLDSDLHDTMLSSEMHGDKIVRLMKLEYRMLELLNNIHPDAIVCESAFYNPRTPNAYASLTEVIFLLKRATINYNPNIKFSTLSPKTVKEAIGSMKLTDKGKDPIKEAIIKIPEVYNLIYKYINNLDNHAIDAIAIGYTFFKKRGE